MLEKQLAAIREEKASLKDRRKKKKVWELVSLQKGAETFFQQTFVVEYENNWFYAKAEIVWMDKI